ncbi:glutathione transferase [Cryptococcus neoformans Tu259-1]|uniref:Glutathione transferase n=1 Tax=Cryptococcus neoformans Tu259-1 TaxID=1230072 RepID=A0A854QJ59_CRYNE|nr:glutathione transferase [Cryptococcus neoformans var. grubii Tu259-1]
MSETDVIIVGFFSFTRLNIDPSLFLLQIPTFPPSPPTTSSSRMISTSPEWFSAPVKPPYKPSPLSISIPIRPLPVMDSDSDSDINQEHGSLSSEAPTPPLSPSDTVSSIEMTGKASSYSTWSSGSDGDTEDVIVTPSCQRPSYQRRNSPSSYFDLDPCRGKKGSRSRSPGVPVSGLIEPMWKLEEKEKSEVKVKSTGTNKLLEPFQMAFPTKKNTNIHYVLDEDSFVLTHVPAKVVSLSAFKPRLPRVPRWQRPIVITVMSIILFGSLCMVSWFQQSLINAERSVAVRKGEWMVKHAAIAKAESDQMVDTEPGYKPAKPQHHPLKAQSKLSKRVDEDQKPFKKVNFDMTKDEELAALMSFIAGTSANALPPIDSENELSLEGFLPFDPRSPHAKAELEELVRTQWEINPIMVLGNMRDPMMREARALFKRYNVKPAPFYVDIDQRSDSAYLSATLEHILGKQTGPYVLLAGKNIGSTSKLIELETKGDLIDTVKGAGASIAKKLKKNKHQKEEERKENERVLGPQRIEDA